MIGKGSGNFMIFLGTYSVLNLVTLFAFAFIDWLNQYPFLLGKLNYICTEYACRMVVQDSNHRINALPLDLKYILHMTRASAA